jgi:ribonucleoside-diphosphate reductase alpha chain
MGQGPIFASGTQVALSDTARLILNERYLLRDQSGKQAEDPSGMFQRVAGAIAAPAGQFGEDVSYWADRFVQRLERLEFLPNSPVLMNAGTSGGQLAACFVLPIQDDFDSIFAALGLAARIQQTGGGTGFSFNSLRPNGDTVSTTGGVSSGPVSFMELFDHSTTVIRAGGRRRGANMAVLRVDHPDVEEFIDAKRTPGRLENFNLSVGVTDAFFAALESGERFPLRNPRTGRVTRTADAKTLFEKIVNAAWESGDPGLLFLDEINRHNPLPVFGAIEATNPCGEQPLLPYESCVLGSLNLGVFCREGGVDWPRLRESIRDATVFLDNVIEANCYPAAEIESATRRTRKIGLGIMGLADLLARIEVPYGSDEAIALGGRIAKFLTGEARAASADLAARRGSFTAFSESVWPRRGFTALRNATVTCVAPTGTISLIAGCSSGIEPFFALAAMRRLLDGRTIVETSPTVAAALSGLGEAGEAALALVRERGSLRGVAGIPPETARRFPIALEISPEHHLRMQSAFQANVDAAVSKTVNLPADAPVEAVRKVYLSAQRLRLKGVTVYRYGSRTGQVLSLVEEERIPDCRECAV